MPASTIFDAIQTKRSLTLLGSDERQQVHQLRAVRELFAEALVEHRDQLEAEERLDAREHHAALLQQVTRRRIERDVFRGAFAGGLRDCHLTRLASHARGR